MVALSLILLLLRATLAWILLAAGIQKLLRPIAPAPVRLSRTQMRLVAATEICIGILLALPWFWPLSAGIAALLFLVFAGFNSWRQHKGILDECGCGGFLPARAGGRWLAVVNLTLAAMAATAVVGSSGTQGHPDLLTSAAAALVPLAALVTLRAVWDVRSRTRDILQATGA